MHCSGSILNLLLSFVTLCTKPLSYQIHSHNQPIYQYFCKDYSQDADRNCHDLYHRKYHEREINDNNDNDSYFIFFIKFFYYCCTFYLPTKFYREFLLTCMALQFRDPN